jgi:hypothetical protein
MAGRPVELYAWGTVAAAAPKPKPPRAVQGRKLRKSPRAIPISLIVTGGCWCWSLMWYDVTEDISYRVAVNKFVYTAPYSENSGPQGSGPFRSVFPLDTRTRDDNEAVS